MNVCKKVFSPVALSLLVSPCALATGTPVIDSANLLQNIKNYAMEVQQYKQQLLQYKAFLKNTDALTRFNWDNANDTITRLVRATDTINQYKQQAGSLERYLDRYQSSNYYQNHPCMRGGCTREQMRALEQSRVDASAAQKKTRDAMMRGLDEQQQTLTSDAAHVKALQQQAKGTNGQMQAIQAATQLASEQTSQLLQIRSLLVAAQSAEATREAERANREAMEAAADARFRAGTFRKSSGKTW